MLQYNPTVSGSLQVTGTITATQGITGSFSGSVAGFPTDVSAFSASLSTRITATESTSSEYVTTSGSLASRVALNEATASQYVTASGSLAARITTDGTSINTLQSKTGSYATTGSNYFIGNQVITGSVYIANDLIVQGSSSLQNITASAVSIGTNTVILNTSTPILRFGGISVYDSGSSQGRSGSLFWDSLADHWINVNPSGSDEGYNSAMIINGPKNTGSLGSESGLTEFYIPVSQGEDHITDSIIFQSGSANIGIGTTVPTAKLDILASSAGSTANILRLKNSSNDTSTGLRVKWDFQSLDGAYLDVTTNSGGTKSMTIYLSSANSTPAQVLNLAGDTKAATFAGSVTIAGTNDGAGTLYVSASASTNAARLRNNDASYGTLDVLNSNASGFGLYAVANKHYFSGNVGIGTTNPINRLDVLETTSNTYGIISARGNNRGGALELYNGSAITAAIYSLTTNDLLFYNGTFVERMRITSGGVVTIGKDSQSGNAALTVKSPAGGNTGIMLIEGDTTNDGWGVYATTADEFRVTRFTNGSYSDKLAITSGGAATFSSTVTTNDVLYVGSGGTGATITWSTGLSYIYSPSSKALSLSINGVTTTGIYINTSGNVGIGTTSDSYKLDINGTGRFTGGLTGADAAFSSNISARNFNKYVRSWASNGSYVWAEQLDAISGQFDHAGWYKGFIRESNGAHYRGYYFDILVGQKGYGGLSNQYRVFNIVQADSPYVGGCGGSSFASIDTTGFTKQSNPCGDNLELYITKLSG